MTNVIRWAAVVVLVGHGLIHLLGVAKGFGWADVALLTQPVGPGASVLWLLAAVLVLGAAGLLASGAPTWWWGVALCAAAVSEVAIVTSWNDAKVGTAVNVLLVLGAGYGFAAMGPISFNGQWNNQATRALADADPTPALVTEADLANLPEALAAYVRHSGRSGSRG